jgi:hypothetical protein
MSTIVFPLHLNQLFFLCEIVNTSNIIVYHKIYIDKFYKHLYMDEFNVMI